MFEHLDPSARRVLERAIREARSLGQPHVGTEHVLLTLTVDDPTSGLLRAHGCGPDEVHGAIAAIVGRGDPHGRAPDELLATLGIDLQQVRRQAESSFGSEAVARATITRRRRRGWPLARWWPGCTERRPHRSALTGSRCVGMAPRLKRALALATRRAAPRPATPVHLLLGILEEGEGIACLILSRRGVDLRSLSSEVRSLTG